MPVQMKYREVAMYIYLYRHICIHTYLHTYIHTEEVDKQTAE